MFETISIDELLHLKNSGELTVIDVRSPSEFDNATIPGSINIPFFNDEERAEVGTLYKQVSQQAAKERGLEIISAKLPNFVKAFANVTGKKAVFCWRGGMRSRTSATVLDLMGIEVLRLDGGYRSYRNWVVDTLETSELKPDAYILNGYTGSGKTTILHRLRETDYPVIDLEGLANHRGSIFGQIGVEPNNQKTFDALLLENVQHLQESSCVLFEGESKRIGKVTLPAFILEKKEQGTQLFIDMPLEERMNNILEDYQPWNHKQECLEAFKRIKKRIHTPIAKKIESDLVAENYASAVRLLLEYYYDPLYDHSAGKIPENQKIMIKANNVDEAVDLVRTYLKGIGLPPATLNR
ncbi:tRNA 2-selenouridine(34) synthase MnmH [Virgibacillus sp. NKC19-3]|uniref:tRNA 2-selenouridine(34) synthase MnmH n=1 Tax=Virgibacillus saliphilus TaxID=2831674 RepID=UPI001C9B1EBB|nr:tRNA 2-selenouridine(34) synthase MnmH [Virgibacillus sp. NKC19-3]MBY7144333.1 tRNA 2-selenouridine(34) synthase MnmH [Virgibacillus sp. NKC19-3]